MQSLILHGQFKYARDIHAYGGQSRSDALKKPCPLDGAFFLRLLGISRTLAFTPERTARCRDLRQPMVATISLRFMHPARWHKLIMQSLILHGQSKYARDIHACGGQSRSDALKKPCPLDGAFFLRLLRISRTLAFTPERTARCRDLRQPMVAEPSRYGSCILLASISSLCNRLFYMDSPSMLATSMPAVVNPGRTMGGRCAPGVNGSTRGRRK